MKITQNKLLLIVGSLAVVGIGIAIALRGSNTHKTQITSSNSRQTPQSPNGQNNPAISPTPSDKQQNSNVTAKSLIAPSGTFVSNHRPNLSDLAPKNNEQSICITTVGATCDIEFTKDGLTKSLGAKVADSNGTVFWTWKPQDLGLSQGNWQVTAKAILNGETKSVQDPVALIVGP